MQCGFHIPCRPLRSAFGNIAEQAARVSEYVRSSAAASSLKFARFAAGVAVAVGLLVLLGWALDLVVLTSILPSLPSMKPNTAVASILCGLALASRTVTSRATASIPVDIEAEKKRLRFGQACA